MDRPQEEAKSAERPRFASLRFGNAPSSAGGESAGEETLEAAAVAEAEPGEDDSRVKVMLRLSAKIRRLIASEGTLRTARDSSPTEEEYRRRDLELDETVAERLYCDARYSAIDAGHDFSDPGPAAEAALLNAIDAVDRALQNTAAVEALLGAVHSLVAAYPARSTEAKA